MTAAAKARAVYRVLESARNRGLLGLDKPTLYRWCAASYGMTPVQVNSGIRALRDGEMLKHDRTITMDYLNGHLYRVVNVSSLEERNTAHREIERNSKTAITYTKHAKTMIKSLSDNAIADGDILYAMDLAKMTVRADQLLGEAEHLLALVAAQ